MAATAPLTIQSARIVWLKNVVREDGVWAYCGDDITGRHPEPTACGDPFNLHWPTRLRHNAGEPSRGDVIVLVQAGHVTHLVEVLDHAASDRPAEHSRPGTEDHRYGVQRHVRVLAMRDRASAPTYSYALRFTPYVQGGSSCRLAGLKRFRESDWPRQGGLAALQMHLVKVLSDQAPGAS